MNEEPQVWHYGLIAQIWAAYDNDPPELPYYQEKIKLPDGVKMRIIGKVRFM